ncbi:LysR family transcriptional regulator [Jiangella alkaliphila]|uniref:DNA-binding transcriptional regulator, LysR family n=1 Tax=Jiangella alkaliphila TaxID=419479 RepID=A0A1H2GXK4_9ACTN|nr:LysR family transcriptional regulator [Jiangella alkaliphila]SDU24259.1 DNA-binding transcriptional regulator, LysR family [Jiangella alkaliphila]
MDLVAACAAFVAVSERGSFTQGAAAIGIPQPVASRRVAALEEHLGGVVFDRTTRRAALTDFGRAMLPAARRMLDAADDLRAGAARAGSAPVGLALPVDLPLAALVDLVADARDAGVALIIDHAEPDRRRELVRDRTVRAAVLPVPQPEARWTVPLGLATLRPSDARRVFLAEFRPGRDAATPDRRIWLRPEDDVPHVGDALGRLAVAGGLRPSQLRVSSLAGAVAEVIRTDDALLCTPREATAAGLTWRPLGDAPLMRGYAVAAASVLDADRTTAALGPLLARCLGAEPS